MIVETQQLAPEVLPSTEEKPRRSMSERIFTQDTFRLRLRDFGKELLKPQGEGYGNCPHGEQSKSLTGKKGSFILEKYPRELKISYAVNLNTNPDEIELFFVEKDNSDLDRGTSQTIKLAYQEVTFGTMWRFYCPHCSKPCNIMFLIAGKSSSRFACRKCLHIDYEISFINKNTLQGQYFYIFNRMFAIADKCPKPKRIFYRNALTKGYRRMTDQYDKYSLRLPEGLRRVIEIELALEYVKYQNTQNLQVI